MPTHKLQSRNLRRLALVGLFTAATASATLLAQPGQEVTRPGLGSELPAGNGEPRTKPIRRPGEEIVITQEEWTALEQFMRANSPSKWEMYLSLPDKPLKQNLRKQIAQRYRTLQKVERSDPVRWKLEIDAIAIEDRIYSTLQELRSGNNPEDRERQLRLEVDRLISNRDHWKRERLLRVKAELESMKVPAALKPVEEELDRLEHLTPEGRAPRVDKRIEEFKKQMAKPPKAILGGHSPASGVPVDAGKP
ncbi:hypothetical protein [Humisphaera borealis]|uniref:DUF3106 domain-containing protein n=1 Tax=Humisphaera borealis TaxID=2807512 RepID=A0A7M2WZD4_9BACT|nr:hypothetical protein [Humisphaera borealis]QOV90221.1 hypothetical protein IPV69_02275 [Humisphaera borealis]